MKKITIKNVLLGTHSLVETVKQRRQTMSNTFIASIKVYNSHLRINNVCNELIVHIKCT